MKAALTFAIVGALCLLAPPVVHCQDPDPPAIDITPLNPVTVEGGSILFSCTYVGELVEVPSLLRFVGSMFQNINDQTVLTPNATTRIVTFQLDNLTNAADNGANFTCSLFQDFSARVTLEVQIPVRYELAANSTQLIEGADEIIDLMIVAFPDPAIFTWYFNGAVITSDGTVTLTAGNITFTPLSRTNAGTYMVRSENPAGNASVSFTLAVQYEPAFQPLAGLGMIVCGNEDSDGMILCAVRPTQGGALPCGAEGNPPPTISGNSSVVNATLSNDQFSVSDATSESAGPYNCFATNIVNTISRTYYLQVGGVPGPVDGLAFNVAAGEVTDMVTVTVSFTFADGNVSIQSFVVEIESENFMEEIDRPPDGTSVESVFTITREELEPGTYVASLSAVNLLGQGEAREAMLAVDFDGSGAVAVASVSFLLTAVLMLFTVLLLR